LQALAHSAFAIMATLAERAVTRAAFIILEIV
jgi:hypothetical protein